MTLLLQNESDSQQVPTSGVELIGRGNPSGEAMETLACRNPTQTYGDSDPKVGKLGSAQACLCDAKCHRAVRPQGKRGNDCEDYSLGQPTAPTARGGNSDGA